MTEVMQQLDEILQHINPFSWFCVCECIEWKTVYDQINKMPWCLINSPKDLLEWYVVPDTGSFIQNM
jgi:hypothetical protein